MLFPFRCPQESSRLSITFYISLHCSKPKRRIKYMQEVLAFGKPTSHLSIRTSTVPPLFALGFISWLLFKMGSLSEALKRIPPDERRAALEDLVANGLRNQDIRFLIERLPQENGRFLADMCALFPPELTLKMLHFLSLEDVLTMRLVSKRWDAKFFGRAARLELAKIHFRTKWERDYKSLRQEENGNIDDIERERIETHFMAWLPKEAKRQLLWGNGCIPARHTLLNLPPIDPEFPQDDQHQYCNARVAFKTRKGIIVRPLKYPVCSLTYNDKHRQRLGKWLLSDQLLVAKKVDELAVYAWRLPPVDEFHQTSPEIIHIPSDIKLISAHQDQIGIILTNGGILTWQFGGGTKLIDTSMIYAEFCQHRPTAFGLLFHPFKHWNFFIFYEWETDDSQRQIVVLEVERGGMQLLTLLDKGIGADDAKILPPHASMNPAIVRAIDPEGLCVISWATRPKARGDRGQYPLLTFDLYKKRFALYPQVQSSKPLQLAKPDPDLAGGEREYIVDISETLFWRNWVLIPAFPVNKETGLSEFSYMHKDAILIRLCPYENMKSFTWAYWKDREGGNNTSGEQMSPSSGEWDSWTLPPIVRGDDDYIVLFGEKAAIVWEIPGCQILK